MKFLGLIPFILLSFFAQAQTDCGPAYQRMMNQADSDLKQGFFKKAFEGFRAARGCKKANLAYIDQQMSAALDSIEQQRLKLEKRETLLKNTLKKVEVTNFELEKTKKDLLAALKTANELVLTLDAIRVKELQELAEKNKKQLDSLQTANKEKIEALLRQAQVKISRLDYDSVVQIITSIHDLPGGKDKTKELLFECAFFYGESGQIEKAEEVFSLLDEKIELNRNAIADYLKFQNSMQYDTLMKMYYPSFREVNGGYFLDGLLDGRETTRWSGFEENMNSLLVKYKPKYQMVKNLLVNIDPITNRHYYLFQQGGKKFKIWSEVNEIKRFNSHKECIQYLNWISTQHGKTPYYLIKDPIATEKKDTFYIEIVKNADGYRLPTNEEWEYLHRMGKGQILFLEGQNSKFDISAAVSSFRTRSLNEPIRTSFTNTWCYDFTKNSFLPCDNVFSLPRSYFPLLGIRSEITSIKIVGSFHQ